MPAPPTCCGFPPRSLALLSLAALLTAAGCRKPEIKSYVAPKDTDEARPAAATPADDLPKFSWTMPAGWSEMAPDKMSVARFSAPGGVNVMITPLPLMSGNEDSLVNMWRQMLGQPLLGEEEAAKALGDTLIGGSQGKIFEVTGTSQDSGVMKVVTAFLHRDTRSWFFKLQGAPAAVDAQREAFVEFLKTVQFDVAAAPAPAAPPAAPGGPTPVSEVPGTPPADWKAQTPGAMQAAKFSVPEKDGAKAEVTVSIFPSDTGGHVANVRRWRGQIGLPEADDTAITALIKPLPGGPADAVIAELENAGRSLTGAIVPRGGRWYFYKLLGDTAAVAAAREAFINYCKAGS